MDTNDNDENQLTFISKMDNNHNNANKLTLAPKRGDDPVDPPVTGCPYCLFEPCILDTGLYQVIVDYERDLRDNDSSMTNKQVRFYLYRHVTHWMHGYLGWGIRIKIPTCVRGEILDLAPEPSHDYVGFIDSANSTN